MVVLYPIEFKPEGKSLIPKLQLGDAYDNNNQVTLLLGIPKPERVCKNFQMNPESEALAPPSETKHWICSYFPSYSGLKPPVPIVFSHSPELGNKNKSPSYNKNATLQLSLVPKLQLGDEMKDKD